MFVGSELSRVYPKTIADLEGFIEIVFECLVRRLRGSPQLPASSQYQGWRRVGEQHTFLGAALVPLRSRPPEPVYVLWAHMLGTAGLCVVGSTHNP